MSDVISKLNSIARSRKLVQDSLLSAAARDKLLKQLDDEVAQISRDLEAAAAAAAVQAAQAGGKPAISGTK